MSRYNNKKSAKQSAAAKAVGNAHLLANFQYTHVDEANPNLKGVKAQLNAEEKAKQQAEEKRIAKLKSEPCWKHFNVIGAGCAYGDKCWYQHDPYKAGVALCDEEGCPVWVRKPRHGYTPYCKDHKRKKEVDNWENDSD